MSCVLPHRRRLQKHRRGMQGNSLIMGEAVRSSGQDKPSEQPGKPEIYDNSIAVFHSGKCQYILPRHSFLHRDNKCYMDKVITVR